MEELCRGPNLRHHCRVEAIFESIPKVFRWQKVREQRAVKGFRKPLRKTRLSRSMQRPGDELLVEKRVAVAKVAAGDELFLERQ
jgi:hypothetical protein